MIVNTFPSGSPDEGQKLKMRLVMIDRNGRDGLSCPFFLCSVCGQPVQDDGWVFWDSRRDATGRPHNSEFCVVDRHCARRSGLPRLKRKLSKFLDELRYNSTCPTTEDGHEYVVPAPSTLRAGVRDDTY